MDALQPLSTSTLAEQTADLIRKRILTGAFVSGERLVEAKIAEQLHVSRGPVREALKQLAAEGLVREEPRRGTFVAAPTVDDVRELYDLRVAVEARAARLVIERQDPGAIDELRRAFERLHKEAEGENLPALVKADYEFHETLCRVSGNGRLHEVFVRNASVLRVLIHLEEEQFYGSFDEVEAQHRELFDSLAAGDSVRAEGLIVEHLEDARDRLLQYLEGNEATGTEIAPVPPRPPG